MGFGRVGNHPQSPHCPNGVGAYVNKHVSSCQPVTLNYHNSKTVTHVSAMNLKRCRLVFVVLSVGAEIINVERRQSRDEQLQLLLVEYRNEALGNDAVETVEERLQLLLYRARHLHLTHKLHVFLLVLLRHTHVSPVWLQVTNFCHPKFLNLQQIK